MAVPFLSRVAFNVVCMSGSSTISQSPQYPQYLAFWEFVHYSTLQRQLHVNERAFPAGNLQLALYGLEIPGYVGISTA